jgi:PAS domain S-box-containing protein
MTNNKHKFSSYFQEKKDSPVVKDLFISIIIGLILSFFVFVYNFTSFFNESNQSKYFNLTETLLFIGLYISSASLIFAFKRYNEAKEATHERIKAESQREKSKEQLQAVLDGVPDIILQMDPQTRVLWANKAALELNPKAIGNFCADAFEYERGSFIDSYAKWAMEGRQIEKGIQYQTSFLNRKGGSYWELIGVPLADKHNNIYGAISIARDITSRMRIEHTWNLLSSVVESTDDAIYGVSLSGTVISWNKGAEDTYGYTMDSIMGKSINPIVPPLERKSLYDVIETVMRAEKMERFETYRFKKDGSRIIISTTICPFVDATGRKIGVSIIDRDITESKISQQKLLESENFNKTIISSVKEGIVVYNSDLKIIMMNKGMEDIIGISSDKLKSIDLDSIFSEANHEEMIERLAETLQGKSSMFQDIFLRTPARQNGGWYNITFTPHINTNQDIIGVIATYRDITQSKIAEVALAYSEEKYRKLVENVSEAIANIAIDGSILFINEVGSNLVGMHVNDIIGKNVETFLPTGLRNDFHNGINNLLASGEKHFFDYSLDLGGGERDFFISVQPVHGNSGEILSLMCLVTDITDRKLAERALEKSQEQLRSLAAHLESVREDERKEIAFEVHDELGQELTALKLDLSWLQTKLTHIDPKLISKINEMKGLIDITIDRVGNISTKLRPDILDHFGLLAAIEWATGDFQKRSGISCELIFDPEDITVDGDIATVIFRILQETLTNVIRHSKADMVEVLFRENHEKLELFVEDNGVGITKEQINAPNAFGLFAINERARSVGGKVEILGEKGKGTKVRLAIPKQSTEKQND